MSPTQAPMTALHRGSGRPGVRTLLRFGGVVVLLHMVLLLSLAGPLDWTFEGATTLRAGPTSTRTITPQPSPTPGIAPTAFAPPSTRLALLEKPRAPLVEKPKPVAKPKPKPKPTITPAPAPAPAEPVATEASPEQEPEAQEPLNGLSIASAVPAAPEPVMPQALSELVPAPEIAPPAPEMPPPVPTMTTAPETADTQDASRALSSPPTAAPESTPESVPSPETTATRPQAATLALPPLGLASVPPSTLLSYRLHGQEKGLDYSATGELRWQRNDQAYSMALTVKAFLLGSRHWRSQGLLTPEGLAPSKFSDSWRSERAAHFDRPNQRIVFSNNAPTVPLQSGAQDQVSLYVQLAAAMAQQSTALPVGTRLQIQTATVRDALPWLLTLEKTETLQWDGVSLQTTQWVCHPRNRFDAKVEFWVAAEHDWLPARIRITQTSGSFIDLQLTGRTALPDLPASQTPG